MTGKAVLQFIEHFVAVAGWSAAVYAIAELRQARRRYTEILSKYAILADLQKMYVEKTGGNDNTENILGAETSGNSDTDVS